MSGGPETHSIKGAGPAGFEFFPAALKRKKGFFPGLGLHRLLRFSPWQGQGYKGTPRWSVSQTLLLLQVEEPFGFFEDPAFFSWFRSVSFTVLLSRV